MTTKTEIKKAEKAIAILKKISADSGYDFHFEDLDITLKGKQFTFSGENCISQELSTFAKEVNSAIGEDEDTNLDINQPDAELIQNYNLIRNQLRKHQHQALTNLKTKRGIK